MFLQAVTIPLVMSCSTHRSPIADQRKTGVFCGILPLEGITLQLIDFTPENEPWVARLVKVENHSPREHTISLRASIKPQDGEARIVNGEALAIHADTGRWNFDNLNKESKNWADRYSLITFNTACYAAVHQDIYTIRTQDTILPAGKAPADYIQYIRDRDGVTDMEANGWLIDFKGDETERYTCRADGDTYGILSDWAEDSQSRNWSLPSCVLAMASTEFFAGYLYLTGRPDLAGEYADKVSLIRNSIDSTFWREDLLRHAINFQE